MAIQTIGLPKQYGAGLGQGIESLLSNLAENKINQIQQQQQAKNLQSVLGNLSQEQAQGLAGLNPQVQQLILKDLLAQPSQQAYAQALGLGGQQAQPQQSQMQPNINGLESLGLLQGKVPQQMLQQLQAQNKQQQMMQQPQAQNQQQAQPDLSRLTERQATELAKIQREEQKEQRKLSHEEQKESRKEKQDAFKFNKEFLKEVANKNKSSRANYQDLERQEELQDSGNLDSPGYVALLERSGLDIPALMNPESEEFKKIEQNFVRNAKQYYGGRISNYEVEQFLKTVPSLSQSPEGRKRVIANLKNLARSEMEYFKVARDIIKENKGVPPYDLQFQVEDKIEGLQKKLAKKFKKDLAKPVPKSHSKLATALGALGGSLLGTIGSGISKAIPGAIGAGIGYATGGPIGAAAGGLGSLFGNRS